MMTAWLWFILKLLGWLSLAGVVILIALGVFFMLWIAYEQSQGRNPFT